MRIYEMHYCNHCGETFEETEEIRNYPVDGCYDYETYYVCPCCKSGDYEDAFKCKICGEYHPESEEGDTEDVCKSCEDKIFKQFYSLLALNFTSEEREILAQNYGLERI